MQEINIQNWTAWEQNLKGTIEMKRIEMHKICMMLCLQMNEYTKLHYLRTLKSIIDMRQNITAHVSSWKISINVLKNKYETEY